MSRDRDKRWGFGRSAMVLAALCCFALAGCETNPQEPNVVYDDEEEVWVDDEGRELHPSMAEDNTNDGWRARSSRRGAFENRSW